MPAAPPLLRRCLDHTVQAAGPLLKRSLDQAVELMLEAEGKAGQSGDRRDIYDARRELTGLVPGWVERYPRELRQALDAPPEQEQQPAAAKALRPSTLTLVDDDQMAQAIESSRLSQLLLPSLEQPLAELDGLVSAALGLPAVRPERNPLRPEVFAKALYVLMAGSGAAPAFTATWTRHVARPLAGELETLYRDLVKLLKSANVNAVSYSVLPSTSAVRPAGGAAATRATGTNSGMAPLSGPAPLGGPAPTGNDARMRNSPSAWADLSSYDIGHPVMQEFLYRGGSQSQMPLAPAYYQRVDEELARLQEAPPEDDEMFDPGHALVHQHLPAVDRPQRHVGADSPLDGQVWGQWGAPRERSLERSRLKRRAERVGQVLGLEVVRKLVNQVAQDPQLLAPVREAIVALEPSLLRLAMVDPRYFSEAAHPGRRLIERVAERSFRYNDEFSEEFGAFAESVAAVFNGLNAQEDLAEAEPFRAALEGMEASWREQDSHQEAQRGKVLDAVRFAEQRQSEADRIAWELSQRTDLENVPAVVQDFVYRSWALVMANARMNDTRGQIDPGGHGAVVSDLLWSVKRELTLRDPSRFFEMIPHLLENLRVGLAELDHDPAEAQPFFKALEKLHRPVLKLRAKHRRDTLDSAAMPLLPLPETDADLAPVPRQQPKPATEFWMGRKELDAAGFEDTLPTDHAALIDLREHTAAAPESDHRPQPVNAEQVIASLHEGCWVDLSSKGKWLRAQLIWASGRGTLFMFVSHGGQPHSMTRRSAAKLVRERLLRLVDTHDVVSQALEALVEALPRQPLAA